MRRSYVEVSCDQCGQADYYRPNRVNEQASDNGWLIVGRKHFCNEACRAAFSANPAATAPQPENDDGA